MKGQRKNNVFVSHSSANKEIAEQLIAYLERLGLKSRHIFCSSIISQGVKNGEKLGTAISKAIRKSKLILFLITNDFINSTYCMQELGVGWHLSEQSKAKCFCLIFPDVSLSEVKGFFNSKIFKFTFIDELHREELGLLAENICTEMSIELPKHSVLNNYEATFFSAVSHMLTELRRKKQIQIEEDQQRKNEIASLRASISSKDNTIEKLRLSIQEKNSENTKALLRCELETIEKRFVYFGFHNGVSKEQFKIISKQFWYDMVNRYEELLVLLNLQPHDSYMELALSTIYAAEAIEDKAFEHMKNYIQLYDGGLYFNDFTNFLNGYTGSMREIILILDTKISCEKEGIVKDSYIELKRELEQRERTLTEKAAQQ